MNHEETQASAGNSLKLFQLVQEGIKLTPMMEQYYQIKRHHPETLLLFRMGDFYEVFFEDAHNAAKILNIAQTHRGKLGEYPIPMAGIPHHAAANYINRLTDAGLKVAICEQVEDPKIAKGIVKRAVTQVVSPGLPFDLDKTSQEEHQYIGSGFFDPEKKVFYLSFVDFTTGKFFGLKLNGFLEMLERIRLYSPKEFIVHPGQWDKFPELIQLLKETETLTTTLSEDYFQEKFTDLYIEKLIPSYKRDETLKLTPKIIAPIGALSYYINSTQSLEKISHFSPFHMESDDKHMKITYSTLSGLEIFPKSKLSYKDSLLGFMDKTKTSMGTRRMRELFQSPLLDEKSIKKRQEIVIFFLANTEVLQTIREKLDDVRDLERIMAKVSTNKTTASDLLNLANAIYTHKEILPVIKKLKTKELKLLTADEIKRLNLLAEKIKATINDEISASLEKGNLIKPGVHRQRDKLAKLSHNAGSELLELEKKYRKETGISNLKVKSNNVAGYFIEVSKSHLKKVPKSFERRQTLVNSERYMSDELSALEKEVITAKEKLHKLERQIFNDIILEVEDLSLSINKLATTLSSLDFLQSLAWVARQEDFTRPEISQQKEVTLQAVWHPLIKAGLKDSFTPHDISLNDQNYFALITGPNMAGKTTVMREVAIVQFLTQLGSFVPAKYAKVSLCDQIFSRLGASDDILKGQSTFMVEMSETAEIIRHASDKSLIILDEIGRGTSTYDGLSIAWSLVEYFTEKTKALTLFSTHYHELIGLVEKQTGAKNLTVKTVNKNGHIRFLYHLIDGGAAQSFGIHVAKLAGLPKDILSRSSQLLNELESDQATNKVEQLAQNNKHDHCNQLDFFASYQVQSEELKYLKDLEEELHSIDPVHLTPFEALEKIQKLKEILKTH